MNLVQQTSLNYNMIQWLLYKQLVPTKNNSLIIQIY